MRDRDPEMLVYSSEDGTRRSGAIGRDDARSEARRNAGTRQRGGGPADGIVRIWLERHGRNGKPVSIVRGLRLPPSALAALAARLKRACATGGTVKDGEIVIQGDHRARIAAELGNDGLQVKLAGG